MSEPTLEQIAESHAAGYWREFRLLARELLALQADVAAMDVSNAGIHYQIAQSIAALEQEQREHMEMLQADNRRLDALEGKPGTRNLERSVAPEEASGEGSFGIELEMWQSWSDRERLRAWDSQKQRAERAERELAEARAENDHLRKSIRNSDRDHWFHRAADLQDEIDAARDDATRLRAWALDRGHKPSCDGALPSYNCTCGLRVALDGAAT